MDFTQDFTFDVRPSQNLRRNLFFNNNENNIRFNTFVPFRKIVTHFGTYFICPKQNMLQHVATVHAFKPLFLTFNIRRSVSVIIFHPGPSQSVRLNVLCGVLFAKLPLRFCRVRFPSLVVFIIRRQSPPNTNWF